MAKYADQTTEAMVGDEVRCINSISSSLLFCAKYNVSEVVDSRIRLSVTWSREFFDAYRFELISRAPSPEPEQPAVTPEQSPPLVVWPEEKNPLAFENLEVNELFVFADANDSFVRQKIGDTTFVTFAFEPTNSPNGYHSTLPDRAVRRLKMIQRPQFTVI